MIALPELPIWPRPAPASFPRGPFQASPAFTAWLDTLPKPGQRVMATASLANLR